MSKWIKFHLSLGKSESGVQILNKRMMEDMHQVTTASFSPKVKPKYPADDVRIGYGYAWYISEYRGNFILLHKHVSKMRTPVNTHKYGNLDLQVHA